mgnify:CR=1 FL=1
MTENKNIPKHWQVKRLEDLLSYVIGGDWGKDVTFPDESYDFAYCIRGSEIKNWEENKGNTASLRKVKKSNIIKRQLKVGDILVEISGGGPEQPVGRTVLIDQSVLLYKPEISKICTNFLRLLRPDDFIDSRFLNLFLKFFYLSGEIVKYQAGSNNLRNLKFQDYLRIYIPIPPLPEQQAIVSKIEELFSELDNGKQQLITAQQQLKVYRQSLLKAAFEGKLTAAWRKAQKLKGEVTLAMAADPEVTYLRNGELPEGWKLTAMNNLIEKPQYGTSKKCDYETNGVGVLRIPNISDGYIDSTDLKFAKFDDAEIETYRLKVGDILIIRSNGSVDLVGKSALINQHQEKYLFAGYLIKLRPRQKFVLPKYLLHVLSSNILRNQIEGKAKSTSGVNNINSEELKSLIIPICSLEEQQLIIDELESKLTVCDKIEETIAQSLQQAETLRQSILKRAFEGKLVNFNEL